MSACFKQLGTMGRIGNQLFQIAATIGYTDKHGDTAVFPEWSYSKYFKNSINQSLVDAKTNNYNEPLFCYSEIPYQENLNLSGFFQSEKYFENCTDLIRKYFEPSDEILNKLKKRKLSKSCSIHVRRGDYVGHPLHDVCGVDYYKNAIEYIKQNTDTKRFYVFSDDIEWCKNNFSSDFIFVDGDEIEDLFLMSLCSHNIISNSSYSWWGAWLNKNKNKVVVAPSKWFNDNKDTKDLLPESWVKIDTKKQAKRNVGLLVIATGTYDKFLQPLLDSARRYFCTEHNVTYFLFTDSDKDFGSDTVKTYKKHEPFPLPTLLRYKTFSDNRGLFNDMDYLYYCDADMLFTNFVGSEIFSDLVATVHPGYIGRRGDPEDNPNSSAYIPKEAHVIYFCGGFNGGARQQFLKMSRILDSNIKSDYQKGIIAKWHDESHLNRYMIDNPPTRILDSGYCYGEDMNLPYVKRLVALTKEKSYVEQKNQNQHDVHSVLGEQFLVKRSKYAVIFYHQNISQLYKKEWVEKCVNSIRQQTFKDFDVFELNYGGEQDRYAFDTGVNYFFESQEMENHIYAMNHLITNIFNLGYEAIFNTNMDDWFATDRFEKQIQCLKEYDLVSCNFYHMDNGKSKEMNMTGCGDIKENLDKKHNVIAHPAVCMNKTFWDDDLHYNDLIGYEDLDLWQRAINKGKKFKILSDYLLYYRIHPKQTVSGGNKITKTKNNESALSDFAAALFDNFVNSNKYLRNGVIERDEIDRHLSGCNQEYSYEKVFTDDFIQIKIKHGNKTAITPKFRYA